MQENEEIVVDIKGTMEAFIEEEKPELSQEEAIKAYKNETTNYTQKKKKNSTSDEEENEDDEHLKRVKNDLLQSLERVKKLETKIFNDKEKIDLKEVKVKSESQKVKQKEKEQMKEKEQDEKERSRE